MEINLGWYKSGPGGQILSFRPASVHALSSHLPSTKKKPLSSSLILFKFSCPNRKRGHCTRDPSNFLTVSSYPLFSLSLSTQSSIFVFCFGFFSDVSTHSNFDTRGFDDASICVLRSGCSCRWLTRHLWFLLKLVDVQVVLHNFLFIILSLSYV